jgi:hypothetical protein
MTTMELCKATDEWLERISATIELVEELIEDADIEEQITGKLVDLGNDIAEVAEALEAMEAAATDEKLGIMTSDNAATAGYELDADLPDPAGAE